jgi:hypothetical protein
MFNVLPAAWLACLTFSTALCGPALAQPAPDPAPAPAPAAAAPDPARPALQGYLPYTEEKILPWKESNDAVGRIGGWKAYAKEAQSSGADAPAHDAPANPHAGHGEKAK